MSSLRSTIDEIKRNIIAIDHYWDNVGVSFRDPPSQSMLDSWQRRCGKQHYLDDKPPLFDPTLKLRVGLHQPQPSVLRELAKFPDHSVAFNYCEPACDLIPLDDATNRLLAAAFVHGYWRRQHRNPDAWSRRGGGITGFSTRKTPDEGERRDGIWDQWYNDLESRLRHTPRCFHFESRMQGQQYLARSGIHHLRDLLTFPFETYFAKRLQLYDIDLERLGRWHHNRCNGHKRKLAEIEVERGRSINLDLDRGSTLWLIKAVHPRTEDEERALGRVDRSLQQLVVNVGSPDVYLGQPIPLYQQLRANFRPARLPGGYRTHLICSSQQTPHISCLQQTAKTAAVSVPSFTPMQTRTTPRPDRPERSCDHVHVTGR